jgi:hypothetical protein
MVDLVLPCYGLVLVYLDAVCMRPEKQDLLGQADQEDRARVRKEAERINALCFVQSHFRRIYARKGLIGGKFRHRFVRA